MWRRAGAVWAWRASWDGRSYWCATCHCRMERSAREPGRGALTDFLAKWFTRMRILLGTPSHLPFVDVMYCVRKTPISEQARAELQHWQAWLTYVRPVVVMFSAIGGAVARPEERKFLGFSISNDGSERRIAQPALKTFKMRVRELTRRTRGQSLGQVIEGLRPYLIGWRSYFGFCQTPRVLTNLEAWIRRRLRMYLWRQWQNGHNRFKELRRRGTSKFQAAVAARSPTRYWRMSGHPTVQMALRNHAFDDLALPRLYVPIERSIRSNRRGK